MLVSLFSGVLLYPGLAVVGEAGSDDTKVYWLQLFMLFHLPLTISLSLVLGGLSVYVSRLPLVSLRCCQSSCSTVFLTVADVM